MIMIKYTFRTEFNSIFENKIHDIQKWWAKRKENRIKNEEKKFLTHKQTNNNKNNNKMVHKIKVINNWNKL